MLIIIAETCLVRGLEVVVHNVVNIYFKLILCRVLEFGCPRTDKWDRLAGRISRVPSDRGEMCRHLVGRVDDSLLPGCQSATRVSFRRASGGLLVGLHVSQ